MAWTDERLNDLAKQMATGFARLESRFDGEFDALRTEMREEFRSVRAESTAMRVELKGDIDALRAAMFRFGIAVLVGLFGLIAALTGAIASGSLGVGG